MGRRKHKKYKKVPKRIRTTMEYTHVINSVPRRREGKASFSERISIQRITYRKISKTDDRHDLR